MIAALICVLTITASCAAVADSDRRDLTASTATLKSCGGCGVTQYPAVDQFIKYDMQRYEGKVVFDEKGGGVPRFVLHDERGEDFRTLKISELTLNQIRSVLEQVGIEPKRKLFDSKDVERLYQIAKTDTGSEKFSLNPTFTTSDPQPREDHKKVVFSQRRGRLDLNQLGFKHHSKSNVDEETNRETIKRNNPDNDL